MLIDRQTEFGARVAQRLQNEPVIWITSVRKDGTPQPTPVWFTWDDQAFLIYTLPGSQKLRNLVQNSRVALNLNSDPHGGDVVIFYGEASIDPNTPPAHQNPAYLTKYKQGIEDLKMTPESFSAEYSVPLRVIPDHIHGF
jgi:PPOX class probable F420-dependent enzyme